MTALLVYFHQSNDDAQLLGRLLYKQGLAYLELDSGFVQRGINISPLNLKLDSSLQISSRTPFNGLHGVFADSLPDGWGLLLMDRYFRQSAKSLEQITPLDRLAYMGDRAMGALSYQPDLGEMSEDNQYTPLVLSDIAQQSLQIYQGSVEDVTTQLQILGGSPGGARPKAIIGLNQNQAISGAGSLPDNYQHWLVKFPTGSSKTAQAEGTVEYIYSIMARNAGIDFPKTQLIDTEQGAGFFACQRFDRGDNNQRIHMHTFAGLVNADFRVPDADYSLLMRATSHVTHSHPDLCEVLRRMIFNILSGNRDDHTKNFSFVMSMDGIWRLSGAYDITFNLGINGHHSMSVMGHGQNISKKAIQDIADMIPLSPEKVNLMIEEIVQSLSQWRKLAQMFAVPGEIITEIDRYITKQTKRIK
ncbi:MAG: serine/threonine-protein kinase HipA [Phenylobacterium sp.]|jgi:serine/threonine-protein kinase HipA